MVGNANQVDTRFYLLAPITIFVVRNNFNFKLLHKFTIFDDSCSYFRSYVGGNSEIIEYKTLHIFLTMTDLIFFVIPVFFFFLNFFDCFYKYFIKEDFLE